MHSSRLRYLEPVGLEEHDAVHHVHILLADLLGNVEAEGTVLVVQPPLLLVRQHSVGLTSHHL